MFEFKCNIVRNIVLNKESLWTLKTLSLPLRNNLTILSQSYKKIKRQRWNWNSWSMNFAWFFVWFEIRVGIARNILLNSNFLYHIIWWFYGFFRYKASNREWWRGGSKAKLYFYAVSWTTFLNGWLYLSHLA